MKKLLTMIGAAAVAAALPLQAEVHSLRPYAYVQSYGCNGVDTGYYAKDTTKFVIDFEFTDVSYKSWLMGAGKNSHKQCHAIYLNGKQQLAWTTRGEFWTSTWDSSSTQIAGSSIKNKRLVQTIASAGDIRSDVKTTLRYFDGSAADDKDWRLSGSATLTSTGPSDITTYLFRGNGTLEDNENQKSKAKIYSFEADDDCESGVPAVFLAPATNEEGAAGFTNVIDRTFHGEICGDAATTALTYSGGIGNAADYKWEDSVFSAKFYAYSADSAKGLVKFGAEAAADETSAWIAHGASATLTAVPADGGYFFTGWQGDTRAITSGTAADATVTVQSDRAGQLLATFARANVVVESSAAMDAAAALEAGLRGNYIAAADDVFTAPDIACAGGYYYTLDGYTLQTWDETNGAWSEAVAHDGNTYAATGSSIVRVTWQWTKALRTAEGTIDDYAQSSDDMLLHLDGILNAGAAAAHADSPSAWVDLVSGVAVATNGSPSFSADAWVADNASYFSTASDDVKDALVAKNFTLELMISHPGEQASKEYGNWVYIGDDTETNKKNKRQLVVDLRETNSKNPLVQGVQYREDGWAKDRSPLKTSTVCKWKTRQYVAVVCDSTGATAYCDGTQIHHTDGGTLEPTLPNITIGATKTGVSKLNRGAEICAVRMTNRALTQDEMAQNQAVDHVRFAPDVIVVNGEIGATGVAGESSLPSGNYDLEAGTWTFTAADVRAGGRTYKPYLTVETLTDGEWVQTAKLWTDSYTVDKAALGSSRIRLTWTWQIRPGLIISFH